MKKQNLLGQARKLTRKYFTLRQSNAYLGPFIVKQK
jgi:hypothetical protein